jgi:hypothetical protein
VTTAALTAMLVRIAVTLAVIAAACVGVYLFFRRRSDIHRRRAFFRGRCRDCGYNPDTGTRTCPECGGSVLDLRLFRPVAAGSPGEQPAPQPTDEPESEAVNHR